MNEETKRNEDRSLDAQHAQLIGAKMSLIDAVKDIQSLIALHAAEARFTKICTTPAGAMKAAGLR